MLNLSELRILAYELIPAGTDGCYLGVAIELTKHDPPLWAIRSGKDVLSKEPLSTHYHFYRELLPSNRDADYLDRHRFASAEEAAEFWETHRSKIIATVKDRFAYKEHLLREKLNA